MPRDRGFRPAWWLPGAHAQTIAGRLLRRPPLPQLRRERWDLPDGDFLDLDFTASARLGSPLVLLLHGLEGSSRRGYAVNTYAALERLGIAAVGLNFRGCSGEPNRLPRSYHSGVTEDLRFVIDRLAAAFPTSQLGAIGFSLGGNVLLKYLGEEGGAAQDRLRAAVAVSVPFDLGACADALAASTMGRLYTRHFLAGLVAKAEAKRTILDGHVSFERVRAARTFREFDDAATAPLHGFHNAEDYYRKCSSARFLAGVRVPTMLLHAFDDPFLPQDVLPISSIEANASLIPRFTTHGGHVGFIEGTPWAPRFWLEPYAAAFFADRILDPPSRR